MISPDDGVEDLKLATTIDQVAREMTAGDASPNLRARVLADIDRPTRVALWRPAFAVLATVVVVFAVILGRGPGPLGPGDATRPAVTANRAEPAGPRGPAPQTQPSTLQRQTSTLRVQNSTLRERNSTAEFAEPPLEEESIAIDRIAPA